VITSLWDCTDCVFLPRWLCIFPGGGRSCAAVYHYTCLWYESAKARGKLNRKCWDYGSHGAHVYRNPKGATSTLRFHLVSRFIRSEHSSGRPKTLVTFILYVSYTCSNRKTFRSSHTTLIIAHISYLSLLLFIL